MAIDDAKFDEILKQNGVTPKPAGGSDWFGQLSRNKTSSNQNTGTPATPRDVNNMSYLQRTMADAPVYGNAVKEAITNTGKDYANAIPNFLAEAGKNDVSTSRNPVLAVGENALGATGSVLNTIFSPITNAVKSASDAFANSTTGEQVYKNPVVGKLLDFFGGTSGKLDEWIQAHPEAARNLNNAITVGATAVSGGENGLDKPIGSVKGIIDTVKNGTNAVTDTIGDVKNKVTSIGTKTPDEILATKPADVHKLTSEQRQFYKDNQSKALANETSSNIEKIKSDALAREQELNKTHAAIEEKAKANLHKETDTSLKQIQDLKKTVDTTAYNKTIELKPKAVQALGEQSKTYSKLIEEDLAPHKNTPITHGEISDAIDKTFPENPVVAESMKEKLGVNSKNPSLKKGELPTIQSEEPTITAGEVYDKTKSLRQEVGGAGKKGSRVYTPDEINIDKTVNALSDVLKNKGVDLSRANNFWREWAPLRDNIVKKLKPFDTGGYETKTFSEILKNNAKGDIHNQNFISDFEKVLGEPITTETKTAMQNLTEAQKQSLATKLDAEMKIQDAKLAKERISEELKIEKEKALSGANDEASIKKAELKKQNLEIDQKAARKALIKKIITTSLGIGVATEGTLKLSGH